MTPRCEAVANWHFAIGLRRDAEELVKRHHYSARPASAIAVVGSFHADGGLFGDLGQMVAACFFGWPPARWSEDVLELVRLVRIPEERPPLTKLIAKTANYIRQRKICDLLVSYADTSQGHHGGVYQAASWHYNGQRPRQMEGVLVNGTFIPGRQANDMWGSRSPDKLRSLNIGTVEAKFDVGKRLYWRPLNSSGFAKAKRLGLRSLPYPKTTAPSLFAEPAPKPVQAELLTTGP